MLLTADDIEPGLVAWMDVPKLLADERVAHVPAAPHMARPFLCVGRVADDTLWLSLTHASGKGNRFELFPEWRLFGTSRWRTGVTYLNDTREPWRGPACAFVEACTDTFIPRAGRARVAVEGLQRIRARMQHFGVWPY